MALPRSCGIAIAVVLVVGGWASQAQARALGALSWQRPTLVDHAGGLQAISCPTSSLCVATDTQGDVLTSTDPTGGAQTWHLAHVDSGSRCAFVTCRAALSSISCTSRALCVATDSAGYVYWSSDVTADAADWQSALIGTATRTLNTVACPSASLCVIAENEGDVATSTEPTAGASAWQTTRIDADHPCPSACPAIGPGLEEPPLESIACPSASFCAVGDWYGDVLTSSDPSGGKQAWQRAYVDTNVVGPHHGGQSLQTTIAGVACPSASMCFASDEAGYALDSSDPAGGSAAWKAYPAALERLDVRSGQTSSVGYPLFDLTCPSQSLCLGLQGRAVLFGLAAAPPAKLYVSEDPQGGAPWKGANIDPDGALLALSCPTAKLCFAVDSSGNVLIGRAPRKAQRRPRPHMQRRARGRAKRRRRY
jgi:hypothetical protein